MRFINRQMELSELKELEILSNKKLFVIALYGLRRVGKTRLMLEFLRGLGSGSGNSEGSGWGYGGENSLYFFVNKNKTSTDLLKEFEGIMKRNGVLGELEILNSWDKFFEVLVTRHTPPAIFDEFQNFSFVEPAVFGILQKYIDLNENKSGMIILSGSLIGMMKKIFQDAGEPLYGRIKKVTKISPLDLKSCFEISKELKITTEDMIKLYGIFGGYPRYYVAMEDFKLYNKTAEEIIDELLLAKDAILEDEVLTILAMEFGARTGLYYSILEAIGSGNTSISAIAGYLNMPMTSLTRQVKELKDYFEIIKYETPFSGKKGIYKIAHPFMDFWFKYIYRRYSDYIARDPKYISELKKSLVVVFGKTFEMVACEFLVSKIGIKNAKRQWGTIKGAQNGNNAYEIDLIGFINDEIVAFEFKWKPIDYAESLSILKKVIEKTKFVQGSVINKFGIVARSISGKEKLRKLGYFAYDLDDF